MQTKKLGQTSFELTVGDLFKKVGLETSFLVDLCLMEDAHDFLKAQGYDQSLTRLCTLARCIGEAKGVLINRKGLSESEANQKIDRVLHQFDVQKLDINHLDWEDVTTVEELATKHKMNPEDIPIVYAFWKSRIHLLLTRDKALTAVCKELGMGVMYIPAFTL